MGGRDGDGSMATGVWMLIRRGQVLRWLIVPLRPHELSPPTRLPTPLISVMFSCLPGAGGGKEGGRGRFLAMCCVL